MTETPDAPDGLTQRCPTCGSENRSEATHCVHCGGPLSAAPPETAETKQPRVPLLPRLLLSLAVALLVLIIAGGVAYRQYRGGPIRYPQGFTLRDIGKVQEAIEAYRQENGALPETLRDLPWTIRVDETGAPVDWWSRPLHYWADGIHYRITSYGYDGKPGGVGLDHDLSSDHLGTDHDLGPFSLMLSLPEAAPTFRQFVTDRGPLRTMSGAVHGSGQMMFLTCVLAGVVTFMLAFRTIGRSKPIRGSIRGQVVILFVTVLAAVYVALSIAAFYAPSGH